MAIPDPRTLGHRKIGCIGPRMLYFGEDDYRLEDEQALLNWSVLRTIVINILRLNGFQSLKTAMTKLANRVDVIFSLLT